MTSEAKQKLLDAIVACDVSPHVEVTLLIKRIPKVYVYRMEFHVN